MKFKLLLGIALFLLAFASSVYADVVFMETDFYTLTPQLFYQNDCTQSTGGGGHIVCSSDEELALNSTSSSNHNANFSFPNGTDEMWYMEINMSLPVKTG